MDQTTLNSVVEMMEGLRTLTGLDVVWKRPEPERQLKKGDCQHLNPFCEAVKKSAVCVRRCQADDLYGVPVTAMEQREPFLKTCHAGVCELVVPIFDYGRYASAFCIGPVRQEGAICPYANFRPLFDALPRYSDNTFATVRKVFAPIRRCLALAESQVELPSAERQIDARVEDALRLMRSHFREPLTAGEVAKRVHLSASRFVHLFIEETGTPFSVRLREIRMAHAQRLLAGTRLDMTSVAAECGFANQNYFATVFRTAVGQTPTAYRKRNRLAAGV
jgi:AraC-like DNA-binding protein